MFIMRLNILILRGCSHGHACVHFVILSSGELKSPMNEIYLRPLFVLLFVVTSVACSSDNHQDAMSMLAEMAYGDVLVYDKIKDYEGVGDRIVSSKRILSANIIGFAGLLNAQKVSVESLPVSAQMSLCYLSNNYDAISSNIDEKWRSDPAFKVYFDSVRNFLEENKSEIMSYTRFAKYARDKTKCYLQDR